MLICWQSACFSQKGKVTLYASDDDGTVFTSIDDALSSEKKVYRLRLTKLPVRDTLPEEIFQLTDLRELTVKGCRLCVLNNNIGKLKLLQVLNLDRNKLLRLPESIGELEELRTLVVSRNIIETLPEAIGKLRKLQTIDAWDNPLYVLPDSITLIAKSLKILDLRQIPITKTEYESMLELLPFTEILFTDICECENRRDHN